MTLSDEPHGDTSGELPRIQREPSGPIAIPEPDNGAAWPATSGDDTRTSIIRRHPTGPIDEPLADEPLADDLLTSIVAPLGDSGDSPTRSIRPIPQRILGPSRPPSNTTAVSASAVSIIGGWATAVVATGLITGWWATDRLFCVGVGFLTAVFGASTIAGVVALLQRRRIGILFTVVAAVLALLIFAGIFITNARITGAISVIPVLPVATIALAVVPATWRWASLR